MNEAKSALIALDWGTTSLRAYRLSQQGAITATRSAALGILQVPEGDFDAALQQVIGDWLSTDLIPVIAAGMIGSRQGWCEAPYITCPADVDAIGKELVTLPTKSRVDISLVPGLSYKDDGGVPDVMRGEETQIVGQLRLSDSTEGLFLLPGTHSKWALVQAGRIVWFATFMSGELFAVLSEHSILGRLMTAKQDDEQAFARGVAYAFGDKAAQGSLLKKLFSTRTLGLFDQVPADGLHAYLSGLIIGTEISEALACINAAAVGDKANLEITIIGDSQLTRLYTSALQQRQLACQQGANDAVATGLWQIARNAGLVEAVA